MFVRTMGTANIMLTTFATVIVPTASVLGKMVTTPVDTATTTSYLAEGGTLLSILT